MDSQTICDFNNGCFATNIGKGVQNLTLRRGCGRQLGDHVFDAVQSLPLFHKQS